MSPSTGSRILRASSGSRSASSSIEPFRSAKSTVTCLRSPSSALLEVRIFSARCLGVYVSGVPKLGACRAGEVVRGAPQPPQNFTPGSLENPQEGHASAKGEPHSAQNLRPALLAVPHRGQFIPCRYLRLLPSGSARQRGSTPSAGQEASGLESRADDTPSRESALAGPSSWLQQASGDTVAARLGALLSGLGARQSQSCITTP